MLAQKYSFTLVVSSVNSVEFVSIIKDKTHRWSVMPVRNCIAIIFNNDPHASASSAISIFVTDKMLFQSVLAPCLHVQVRIATFILFCSRSAISCQKFECINEERLNVEVEKYPDVSLKISRLKRQGEQPGDSDLSGSCDHRICRMLFLGTMGKS